MIRVSEKELSEEVWVAIHERFVHTLLSLKDNSVGKHYLDELLTPHEHIVLSKRLAIILMSLEGYSQYRIFKTLHVSTSTVGIVRNKLDAGAYASIEKIFCNKKEREAFWVDIEVIIRGGMPAYGKGRWNALNKLKDAD